jgi:O-antigen ligase
MIKTAKPFCENLMAALLMAMVTGLFVSRAVLGAGVVVFFVAALVFYGGNRNRNDVALFFALAFALLFLLPLVSGIWSADAAEWQRRILVKLPLLLLPPAFYFYRPPPLHFFAVSLLFILFVTCGSLYSVYEYALNSQYTENHYLRAGVMPVSTGNDHIRFSWLVVIACILMLRLLRDIHRRPLRWAGFILIGWLVVFLHILAAKTGLLLLYGALFVFVAGAVIQTRKKWPMLLLLCLPLMPFIAYHTLPTFKNRVQYMLYDYRHYSKNQYREGLSDGMRLMSLEAGVDIWKKHPAVGVGFGDVAGEVNQWYTAARPRVQPYEQILPSSQLLLYAAGGGVLGLFCFITALLLPLTRRALLRHKYFMAFYVPATLSFIFEIHLESQYGCFIFCFFALWTGLVTPRTKIKPASP